MDERQLPESIYFCDRKSANQDVSICLVPNEINRQQDTDMHSKECLEVVKAHSHRLKECSKYFEACLSERWRSPNPSTPIETSLEVIHGVQFSYYRDCFSRMYTPFRKDFQDVEYSLNLLRVASQIEFHNLMSSICRYLSTIVWSVEDELRIRAYASSLDFPRSHAKDLVARLEFDDPSKNACGKHFFELLVQCLKSALQCKHQNNPVPRRNFSRARSLIEELLLNIGHTGSSTFETDLVVVINHEVEEILVDFHNECIQKGGYDHHDQQFWWISGVPEFQHKLQGICWILDVMMKAKVADDVVKCFLQLQLYPKFLFAVATYGPFQSIVKAKPIAEEFAKLVMLIYQEAVVGNLLLGINDRVVLLENWQLLRIFHDSKAILCRHHLSNDVLNIDDWGYEEVAEKVFLTLPFKEQMEFIKRCKYAHHDVISANSLATLVLKNYQAEEHARMQVDADVGMD